MPVTETTYERLALEDPEGQWEYVRGRVRQKPGTTQEHNVMARRNMRRREAVLPEAEYDVSHNSARLRSQNGNDYIPGVVVLLLAVLREPGSRTGVESYGCPVPFVVEIWSPSTGSYDADDKLPDYRARGDLEVWRIHIRDRSITARRRQADGSCSETTHSDGEVPVLSLPGVRIKFEDLFGSL